MKKLETEMDMYEYNCCPPQFEMAIQRGKELIPLYKQIFGYDAFVTFFLLRMCNLYQTNMFLRDSEGFIGILKDVVKYLEISHGSDHELFKFFKATEMSFI